MRPIRFTGTLKYKQINQSQHPPPRPNVNKKKRTCHLVNYFVTANRNCKNKRKQKDEQIIGFCQRIENAEEHESDDDTNNSFLIFRTVPKDKDK